jgi:hypothetical protein
VRIGLYPNKNVPFSVIVELQVRIEIDFLKKVEICPNGEVVRLSLLIRRKKQISGHAARK